jgi:hypothetical protein
MSPLNPKGSSYNSAIEFVLRILLEEGYDLLIEKAPEILEYLKELINLM